MELRNFISKTILDIVGGVADAQKELPLGCVIPSTANTFQSVETGISDIQAVEFEVTVRADERAGSEAKLNVVAAVIGGGVKGESGKSGGHVATLKFRVPIRLQCKEKEARKNA
jgi:hypothetical protein